MTSIWSSRSTSLESGQSDNRRRPILTRLSHAISGSGMNLFYSLITCSKVVMKFPLALGIEVWSVPDQIQVLVGVHPSGTERDECLGENGLDNHTVRVTTLCKRHSPVHRVGDVRKSDSAVVSLCHIPLFHGPGRFDAASIEQPANVVSDGANVLIKDLGDLASAVLPLGQD